jgi:hypothetical protein
MAPVARIAAPSVVPDRGERRGSADGRAAPFPGFGLADPAPVPGR